MSKLFSPLAAAGAILPLLFLGAAPAQALSLVTFVSGKGTDAGTCANPANPCRSFQFAISQTGPGGEVKALDPANYLRVTILKSITITGVEGASINSIIAANAITINAGPNDTINLSHLTLDGRGLTTGLQFGIEFNSGGSLTITHCAIRNFVDGVVLRPDGALKFLIADTEVSGNSGQAIVATRRGTGSAQGTLENVMMIKNGHGVGVHSGAKVTAINSSATNNRFSGFFSDGPTAVIRLVHSAATENANGVEILAGGTAESAGNNFIFDNVKDVSGILTNVGTK